VTGSQLASHWDVVIAGGRIAGATAAWALAPYAGQILVVDASGPASFWPQQSSWDRTGNLIWDDLGLLERVLSCGAPPTFGHSTRDGGEVTERDYPQEDSHSFRMTVPREILDQVLLDAAGQAAAVTIARPGRVREILPAAGLTGRQQLVVIRHAGQDQVVSCDLLVLADGRLSRNADRLAATPYLTVPSPWVAMLAYYADLPLPADRGYFAISDDSVTIATPSGPGQWCISTDTHQAAIAASGQHPAREFERRIAADPHLGPAIAAGRRMSPIGGAGKLKMSRRPMSGPGWCLVGDAGYFLDPVTARGTLAALTTVQLLRDQVAEAGDIGRAVASGRWDRLTEQRDAALASLWTESEQICALAPAQP
jgi:2-polyprenyl-6-methoxyphenol hydroxylase-like FAD-dependent oxidoreductase